VNEPDRPLLVLASSSQSRRRILDLAGIAFEVIASGVEESWDARGDPAETVLGLATAKATDVAPLRPGAYVLGCDSLFCFDGELLGKAATEAEAAERWRQMGGRSGALYTGHALVHRGEIETEVVATTVTFDRPTREELDAYVATRESIGSAGAFTLEGRSSAFIPAIGGDANNVLGLSVVALRRLLARYGVPISALWR
jgi:septum formation protein